MFTARKSMKPLLLAGVAAVAYYAYTKMSEEQKRNIVDTVKKQGKDLWGRLMPNKANNMQQGDMGSAEV